MTVTPAQIIKLAGSLVATYLLVSNDYAVFLDSLPLSKTVLMIPIAFAIVSLVFHSQVLDFVAILVNFAFGSLSFRLIRMELFLQDSLEILSLEIRRMWTPLELQNALLAQANKHNLIPTPTDVKVVLSSQEVTKMSQIPDAVTKLEEIITAKQILLQNAAAKAASNAVFFDNLWYYGSRLVVVTIIVGSVYYYFTSGSLAAQVGNLSHAANQTSEQLKAEINLTSKAAEQTVAAFNSVGREISAAKADIAAVSKELTTVKADLKEVDSLLTDFHDFASPFLKVLGEVVVTMGGGYTLGTGERLPEHSLRILDVLAKFAREMQNNR